MKLYIPEIGDILVLKDDWTFDLYYFEKRNASLFKKMGFVLWREKEKADNNIMKTTLQAGTELKVNRIYIRQGRSDFSSVTFRIVNGSLNGCRFWAKLRDCNKIELKE